MTPQGVCDVIECPLGCGHVEVRADDDEFTRSGRLSQGCEVDHRSDEVDDITPVGPGTWDAHPPLDAVGARGRAFQQVEQHAGGDRPPQRPRDRASMRRPCASVADVMVADVDVAGAEGVPGVDVTGTAAGAA
jgi:hypothetical protein